MKTTAILLKLLFAVLTLTTLTLLIIEVPRARHLATHSEVRTSPAVAPSSYAYTHFVAR